MHVPSPLVTAFSLRRQALDGSLASPLAVLEACVGVYSANPAGPLSIRARARGVRPADILALEPAGLAVRSRAMRTSAFLVPRSTHALIRAATDRPLERFSWMLDRAGVSAADLPAVAERVVAVASEPLPARELRARAGLELEISPLVGYLCLRGDLVAMGAPSLTSNQSLYVAVAAAASAAASAGGVGPLSPSRPGVSPDPAEARAWLAGAYLRSFGPARVEDLAWWAGWPIGEARRALGGHQVVDLGDGLLLPAADLPALEGAGSLTADVDAPVLLPKWDAWTMGYELSGRGRFLDRDVHDRIFDGDGNGLGMVLVGGRAVGAWISRSLGARFEADLDLFDRGGGPARMRLREAVERELGAIGTFLGYREVRAREVDSVLPERARIRRPLDPA